MLRFESQRFVLVACASVLALGLVIVGRADPADATACNAPTKVWDGGAGSGSWMDKENWNGDTVPTLTDDVCISGADVTVTATGGNAIARTFEVAAGRTLTVNGTLQPNGPAESLVNAGATLAVSGILTGAGGTSPLRIEGSLEVSASSQITLPTTNAPGGVITKSSAGTSTFSGTFANAGSMAVNAGTLRLNQATGSSSGSVAIAAGAVLSHTSGAFTYSPTASISGAGDLTVAGATVTLSAGTTYGLDEFIVSAGTLTLNQAYTIPTVTMTGGTINGPGNLVVTSLLAMSGGPVMAGGTSVTTTLVSSANASLSVPSGTLFLGRTLSIEAGASVLLSGNGAVTSGGGGSGAINNAGLIIVSGNSQITVPITNTVSGTMRKSSTGTTTLSGILTNSGEMWVDAGTLRLAGATTTVSGTFRVADGAVLTHATGSATYGSIAAISGSGEMIVAGATVTLSAGTRYDLDAFQVTAGTLTLNDSYTIPTVSLTGATINGPGHLTVTSLLTVGANSTMAGGAAAVTNVTSGATARISLASGNMSLSRTLSFASGATASIEGNGTITSGGPNTASIVNGGALAITGNSTIVVPLTNQATGTITKSSSGTTTLGAALTNNGDLTVAAGLLNASGTFANYNQATDILSGGSYVVAGTLRFVGADVVTNQATIVVDGTLSQIQDGSGLDAFRNFTTNVGSLTITGGRTLTLPKALTSTGAITVGSASTLAAPSVTVNSGTLSGRGTVAAPVSNGGTVLPGTSPGILTITGSYTQTAGGHLDIEIGGDIPGTGHDQLNITGAATLDGTLNLSATGGFAPSIGQTFTILTYASHTGCFATINGRDLATVGQGMFFDVSCGPTSAVVTTRRAEISIDDATLTEGNSGQQPMTFTISQNVTRPDLPTSVQFASADGSAVSPADYAAGSGTLTFVAGDTALTRVITVEVEGDLLDEFDEHFAVELSNASNAYIAFGSGAGTIVDDDPPPTVTIDDVNVDEGDSGVSTATFTVSISGPSGKPISVEYETADGTATPGEDYAFALGQLTFAPGDTTRQIAIDVSGDLLDEFDETFAVELQNPVNVVIADGSGTGTILDEDPPPTISVSDATVIEGDSGTTWMWFEVALSGVSGKVISVDYATADGTATAPGDYTAASGKLVFGTGHNRFIMGIGVHGDTLDEIDENFTYELSNPLNVVIADGSGTGTIADDDPAVSISIDDVAMTEGDTGTTPATFTVTLSSTSGKTVSVDYATANGTATAGSDYSPASGTLTFAPGATSQQVSIDVLGDIAVEGDEAFDLLLSNPSNATIADSSGTATIINDDTVTADLSIDDVTVTEGDSGISLATFTVTLSTPRPATITVDYATADGTAAAGTDYIAASGTLVFAPGTTSRQFNVDVTGDTAVEADETFEALLSNAKGAAIADGSGTATILNDDVPTIAINDVSAPEGNAGTSPATFSVTLSAASSVSVTVHYATANGTATAPADYATASGTLTFVPGETAKPLVVAVQGDTLDEPNEAFGVNLSSPSNATIGDGAGAGTIADDDPAPTLRIDDQTAVEGDTGTTTMTFNVVLSGASGQTITVQYATANGSATATDYVTASGTLTFAAGDTSKQLTVSVRGDTVDEPNETFSVNLSNPSSVVIADGTGVGTITDDDPKPTMTSISPAAVPQGATLTIRGSNLSGTTQIAFARAGGGTVIATTFRVFSDTRVTATVPALATTGRVTITTPNGVATSPSDLLIQPTIGGFSPTSGPVGTVVTIAGSGFTGVTSVRFGTTAAVTFAATSDTQITASVPVGASSGKITVVTPGGSNTSMSKFIVR